MYAPALDAALSGGEPRQHRWLNQFNMQIEEAR
jgi:hypothetical protein